MLLKAVGGTSDIPARHRHAIWRASPWRTTIFVERKLYPNVDFYSGIIYKALGIPVNMFTVIFAIGRMPGWLSQWQEFHMDPKARIGRPRQIYMGANERDYVAIGKR